MREICDVQVRIVNLGRLAVGAYLHSLHGMNKKEPRCPNLILLIVNVNT